MSLGKFLNAAGLVLSLASINSVYAKDLDASNVDVKDSSGAVVVRDFEGGQLLTLMDDMGNYAPDSDSNCGCGKGGQCNGGCKAACGGK